MPCEQRDGCSCSEESHVELRRELEETKRELQRLKSLKEKPVSRSDAETLGTEKTLGPLMSTDGLEMFKVGPQTELLHASCGGGNQRCDSKILSFIQQAVTLERELDILFKERRIILSHLEELQTSIQSSEAAVVDKAVKPKTAIPSKAISNQKYPMWETGRTKGKQQLGSKKVQPMRHQEKTRIPERDGTPSVWKKLCGFFWTE